MRALMAQVGNVRHGVVHTKDNKGHPAHPSLKVWMSHVRKVDAHEDRKTTMLLEGDRLIILKKE